MSVKQIPKAKSLDKASMKIIVFLYLLYFVYADDIMFRPKDASSNQPSFALVGYLGHAIIGCLAMRQA